MANTQNKTQKTKQKVSDFIASIKDQAIRADCKKIAVMMKKATGTPGSMWGKSIAGFGSYHYSYASGREGDWFMVGFSPRKQNLTLYIMDGFADHQDLMKNLGKYKTGVCCLYIKRLSDVDEKILEKLINQSIIRIKNKLKK